MVIRHLSQSRLGRTFWWLAGQPLVQSGCLTRELLPGQKTSTLLVLMWARVGKAFLLMCQYESTLLVTGVSVGTTTITVEVVGPNTNRFGPASSFRLRKTLRVRVVPCAYRVDVTSFWVTRMYNADVLVSATMVNIPLTSITGVTFSNDPSSARESRMQWKFTTNRLKGCIVGNDTFREQGVSITGAIIDDELGVTVTIPELPTSTNLYIQCHRPEISGRIQTLRRLA